MPLTVAQLKKIAPLATNENLNKFVGPVNDAMEKYNISTPEAQAMFLAQILHESASFRYVRELASGAAYDVGKKATDLGNVPGSGDGPRFKGRGLIQVTGRANYAAAMLALDIDCLNHPELLEEPKYAALSAAWYWSKENLSSIAQKNTEDAFITVTKRINGGTNGLDDRKEYWARAKAVLGVK